MKKLRMTTPHYIIYVLLNTQKRIRYFIDSTVLKQLRCNGVLEGIRITRLGYPNRIIYNEFLKRYFFLGTNINKKSSGAMPVVKDLMKLFCEKYKKQAKSEHWQIQNRVTELVGGLHVCVKAISQRKLIEQKRNEQIAINVIQDTIHTWYQFRNWVWFRLLQKVQPTLKRRRKLVDKKNKKREVAEKALSEMKIKNVDLEALVEELKEDIEPKKVSLDKADIKSREEQEHIEELQADNQRLQDGIIEHKTTIAKKDSVITELNKDIEDMESEISDLKKQLVAEEDNSKNLETQLHEKEDDIADLEKQTKTAALTSAKNANDKKISLLNSEKDELEDKNRKLDELIKKIEDGLNDSDMLKAQKADYEAQIQALKDDMEKTGKDLAGAKSNMHQKDVEINNLNEQLA
ncbi:myosin-7, putative [Entamoeba invadens IP1]|uniref:Myosin-7, putative n=1 Tax=Entamoeba invadens IP1 TaxID=370355 RepID=L7FLI4_ENTIV|nr:myosin-7, putative [Entamoeba invadens IP1]ELP86813.1 myosin-7, putative [Entamoeba invadens IP1]|eukprot:XP_004253584.1 myosin-7, putative [Entamoeba invadens IP1]